MNVMRALRRFLFLMCLLALLVGAGGYWLRANYIVPVMMYHHVLPSASRRADSVSPERFEMHMSFLRKGDYNVIGLDQLVAGLSSGRRFPFKTVAVTFDDGYQDNIDHALPVLRKHRIPAAFFVSPFKFGRVEEFAFMDWPQIKALQREGMIIGSHGLEQRYLPEITEREQETEIFDSKRLLEAELAQRIDFYAYPVGGFTDRVKAKIKAAGYLGAFTTNRGTDRFNRDVYEINRIRFSDRDDSEFILWAKLTGFYNLFREMKDPH